MGLQCLGHVQGGGAHLYLAKIKQGAGVQQAPELAQQGSEDAHEVQPAAHGQQQQKEAAHAYQHRLHLALQAGMLLPLLCRDTVPVTVRLSACPEVQPSRLSGTPSSPRCSPQRVPSPPQAAPLPSFSPHTHSQQLQGRFFLPGFTAHPQSPPAVRTGGVLTPISCTPSSDPSGSRMSSFYQVDLGPSALHLSQQAPHWAPVF